MAEPDPDPKQEPAEDAPARPPLRAVIGQLRQSAILHWKRSLAGGVTILVLIAGLAIAWTFIANFAIQGERDKLTKAFAAMDAGDYDQASSLVRHVLNSGALPHRDYGGPLFVLGAVKAHDADGDGVPERRHTEYLVASRYLREARSYGIPPNREKQSLLLLGKSLIESFQIEEGIEVLATGLSAEPRTGGAVNAAIHRVLAEAYTQLTKPDFDQALSHATAVLNDEELSPDQRIAALLLKAKILDRLNRAEEARQTLATLPAEAAHQPAVLLARGQILLDGVESALQRLPAQDGGKLPPELTAQIDEAVIALREAQTSNHLAADVVRRSLFLMGRAAELRGDQPEALKLYTRTHQQFGESPEGLAAKLAVADMARHAGDDKTALYWYRQVLQGDVDPVHYRSEVLPLGRLRERILDAVGNYVDKEAFANVTALLDQFIPLFSRTEELALRGDTMRRWGDRELQQATAEGEKGDEARHAGLRWLREAGVAYERLAALHFATQYYTTDIWNSADCFFRGQSYSNAARVLDIYLQVEPEKLNAQALLRLGQAGLALGRVDACIQSLEECIELYGNDNATYQARIDLAKAYGYKGNAKEAEHQLRFNLTESSLKPQSPEWRDSLFALGTLLFEQGRNEEAIGTLEEAVERYPNDRQTIEARYMIGEAYRRWSIEPLVRLEQARTNSEREKNQQLVNDRLSKALENFKVVQSSITLKVRNAQDDPIYAAMRRNCYMLEGAVLFDMGRYKDAIEAYQNVSSLYPNQPFVLETFVQIANCWQKLDRPENAEGAIKQAQSILDQIPSNADFASTTAFSRDEWHALLNNMRQ